MTQQTRYDPVYFTNSLLYLLKRYPFYAKRGDNGVSIYPCIVYNCFVQEKGVSIQEILRNGLGFELLYYRWQEQVLIGTLKYLTITYLPYMYRYVQATYVYYSFIEYEIRFFFIKWHRYNIKQYLHRILLSLVLSLSVQIVPRPKLKKKQFSFMPPGAPSAKNIIPKFSFSSSFIA